MNDNPYISILIVSWNALETLKTCLPSVVATTYDSFEIIFIDNASSDGSSEWVHASFPDIRIVRNPENWAFCKGNNVGSQHARGEILVLLNNDVEVPPDWLTSIADRFKKDSTVAAAQPKLRQYVHREFFEYAGAAGGFLDRNGYPFTRGRIFDTVERDAGQYDSASEDLFWASGTCLAVRKSIFVDLGGLEESFFMHMEEIDLCWRIRSAGYRIVLIPASVVFHIGGASLSNQSSRKQYLNFRNNLVMLYRNLSPVEWRRVLLRRLALDSVASVRALFSLKPRHAYAILHAYVSARKMISVQKSARPSDDQAVARLPYRGSIVWDYFVRGRKRFSELPKDLFNR